MNFAPGPARPADARTGGGEPLPAGPDVIRSARVGALHEALQAVKLLGTLLGEGTPGLSDNETLRLNALCHEARGALHEAHCVILAGVCQRTVQES